jgi:ABC-type Fe3+-hydroxamate transport system substrate-binding protein
MPLVGPLCALGHSVQNFSQELFMSKIALRSGAVMAALLTVSAAAGCAKDSKPSETAERAEETSGKMTQTDSLSATVEEVDPASRMVTLRDPEGRRFVVEAGEGVAVERLRPNDEVKVVYQESIAFALADENAQAEPTGTPAVQETRKAGPDGVQFGRQIDTTVEIVAIAPEGKAATFRVPSGDVRTVEVGDAKNQEKVAALKPGDSVKVTYTEKLALAVDGTHD